MNDSLSGRQIWVHRLCGLPGDRIEIRNDTLFVNGENADQQLNLRKYFVIPRVNLEEYDVSIDDVSPTEMKDSLLTILQTKKDSALIAKGRPHFEEATHDTYVEKVYHQRWTISNFGPYIVPIGKYFVLGDNRHSSLDSRYTGPVDMKHCIGRVIGR
jgi:signal peptidase I